MSFRKLIFIIFIIILCVFITSYSIKSLTDTSNTRKTVVFWTLQLGTFDKYVNNIISQYENTHKDVKIKWIDIPYSEGEKRTLAAVLTDNPPDLVNLTPDFSLLLAQKKALYTFDENKLTQFLPSLLQMLKFEGKYYAVPFYATSPITLRNKNLSNKEPETYDELFLLTAPKGSYITMFSFSENDTLLKLLNKYNINNAESINNNKSVELFSLFKKLYDNNQIPKESVTQSHRDALEKYMSGQIAFLVTGANFLNMIKENAPSVYKNTEILPQLTGDTGLYDYSLMDFVIPLKAKNKEEALDFALFFTNKINQLEFAKITPILPVNKEALNDDYFRYTNKEDIQSLARIQSAKQLNKIQPPLSAVKNKKDLNTLSSSYVQEILINNAPIKDTLDKFSKDWSKLN